MPRTRSATKPAVSVQVWLQTPEAQSFGRQVSRSAQAMVTALGLETRELSVLLCLDKDIRKLNRTYRGQDKPTDVLAFAQDETPWTQRLPMRPLGDIAISLPTAKRQARLHRVPVDYELSHLLAHGLLHLLGLDHADENERRRMMAATDALLAVVGKAPARGELWAVPH